MNDPARIAPAEQAAPPRAAAGAAVDRRELAARRLYVVALLATTSASVAIAALEWAAGITRAWEVWLAVAMLVATTLGGTAGFHRLLAHRAFKTGAAVKAVLLALGSMQGQGPPMYWVANHRRHHRFADMPGDPHSPRWIGERPARHRLEGFLHAHIGWVMARQGTPAIAYCRDLYQDPVVLWINRHYYAWLLLGLALPALAGACIEPYATGAAKGLLWGGGVRLFVTYHGVQAVGSVGHMFGAREFETREHSTNNFWLAITTLGEGWHNNHHACAGAAFFGVRWWQLDLGGLFIRLLERTGLATDVVRHTATKDPSR
jgi:stearoyl-CoA desaturase (Delta-9 desaturase)